MKTVLITGCSSGIGLETARLFQQKGWQVAATVRRPEDAIELTAIANCSFYKLDVNDLNSIQNCISQVLKDFGSIDVLVNNAGVYDTNPLESVSDEQIQALIDTNVLGTLRMTKALLPHFRERKGGTIVNISSVAGLTTFPYQTLYHTSKWAIEGFSEALSYEARDVNVRVKVVEPGMVKTNLYRNIQESSGSKTIQNYSTNYMKWLRFLLASYKGGYSPVKDARTIYKAVTDRSHRLRYKTDANTRILHHLHSLLPLRAFNAFVCMISGM